LQNEIPALPTFPVQSARAKIILTHATNRPKVRPRRCQLRNARDL
jgi:hypothetical protein